MKRRLVVLTVVLTIVTGAFDVTARAGFIDDWLTQKTQTAPGYFEGEKRGYATGGSISARWPMANDHLFAAEPPRFKVGCGGIDLFMGGFSFLDVNYLVQKMQRVLQAAPAMAFDLALKTLCEPCSNTMKALEELANGLNGLQMNDCHDAKVLAAKLVSPFTDDPKVKAEAQQDFSLQTGLKNIYKAVNDDVQSNSGRPSVSNESGMFANCPAEINNLFFTQGQSVLSAVANDRGIPLSHVELLRGFLGDLQFDPLVDPGSGTNSFMITATEPCPQNSSFGLDSLLDGSAFVRPLASPDAACVPISDANANLIDFAQNQVTSVYNNILNQGAFSNDDRALIDTVPLVYHNLLYAAATRQGPQVIQELADFTARAYAFALVKDLYSQALYSIRLAQKALKKQGSSPASDCQISSISIDVDSLKVLDDRIHQAVSHLQGDYQKYLAEHATLLAVGQRYTEFMSASRDQLSKVYSPRFVNRVMSKM